MASFAPEIKIRFIMEYRSFAEGVPGVLALCAGVLMCAMCGKDADCPDGGNHEEVPPPHSDTLYVTGVEYPAGYDWVKDPEYGTVPCRLFMEKEGERIVEIPVGYSYETASDPDMHRCAKGHLYTDYSTDSETVIKRDGVELFRYPGREMISGFYVSDSTDVYTLGQPRSGGSGFTFRRNGEVLLDVPSGCAVSDISEKDGRLYLVYRTDALSDGSGRERQGYYIYADGGSSLLAGISSNEEILHAVVQNGQPVCVLGGTDGSHSGSECFFRNGTRYAIETEGLGALVYCRILYDDDDVFLSGVCRSAVSGECTYAVWDGYGKHMYSLASGQLPFYSFACSGNIYDFTGQATSFDDMTCHMNGKQLYSYGRNLSTYGSRPAAVCRDSLYFIFSDRTERRQPYVAVQDRLTAGGFNGFYTGVSAW